MKHALLLLLALSLYSVSSYSQKNKISAIDLLKSRMGHNTSECKSDLIHNRLMQTDSKYRSNFNSAQAKVKDYLSSNNKSAKATLLTVPVVVHVLHLGESVGTGTNISDAQIQSAIDNMNDCYAGTGTYTTDTDIQFQLAVQDPNCSATTGIVRVNASGTSDYSTSGITNDPGTSLNEVAVKALSKWPNSDYYNIWIVAGIDGNMGGGGVQGYAYFPGAGSAVDGAVVLYNSFGYDPTETLGYNLKSYTNYNVTANHELGHALNLYHTFEGDDGDSDGVADQCPVNADPSTDGDQCSDTDPHRRDDGDCGDSGFTCAGAGTDLADIVTNIMAYSSDACQVKFSSGQSDRMRAALQTNRAGLLTSKALDAPGAPFSPPLANSCTPQTDPAWGLAGNYGGIQTVQIKDITNNSGYPSSDNAATGTLDLSASCQKLINVTEGELVALSVTTLINSGNKIKMYVDYDNSGSYDVSEEVFSATGVAAFSTTSGNFTIPGTATTNTTLRLRVIQDLNAISGPCHNPQYGQAEDYPIYISPTAGGAPVADFSANQTGVCQGTQINFTDLSTNTPTGWAWNFGDGLGTSTAQNPSYTYPSAGSYTVTLTATNASGSDPEVKTSYITITDVPGNAGAISGSNSECSNTTGVAYSLSAVSGATDYTWTAPAGSSIASGQGTSSVTINFGSTSGTVQVTPSNSCGNGGASTLAITLTSCATTQLAAAHCGATGASMTERIYADVVSGATAYSWRFRNGGVDYTFTRAVRYVRPSELGLPPNTTFDAYVSYRDGSNTWQSEGPMCNYTSSGPSQTMLATAHCGATGASMTERIYADAVSGATAYSWRFRNGGVDYTFTRAVRYVRPSELGLPPNTTFDAYVSYRDGNYTWQPEGPMCNYTTSAEGLKNNTANQHYNSDLTDGDVGSELNAYVFPNPVNERLYIRWRTAAEVMVTLVNLNGKIMYQELISNGQEVDLDMSDKAAGIYVLRIADAEKSQTIKVVRQ